MRLFCWGVIASFLGWVLEVIYARATKQAKKDRKCCLVLPLCPVYGLGAVGILLLPQVVAENTAALWLIGGAVATAAEYALGWFYEAALGVKFWDYSRLRGNVRGRVCPVFGAIWGALAVALRRWGLRWLEPLAAAMAPWAGWVLAAVVADGFLTLAVLSRWGTTDALKWYDQLPYSFSSSRKVS